MENAGTPLVRQLGMTSATSLVVANMVGTGIFTTTGFLAADLGSPTLILLAWLVGGICAFLGALCYSELALNFQSSGGEYLYLSRAYGPTWGFVSGWVSLFAGFSAPIAAAALAFANYALFLFPAWQSRTITRLIACSLILAFSLWNCIGVRQSAHLQNVLTMLKFALLLIFVVSAITVGHGDWQHLNRPVHGSAELSLWQPFAMSLFWVYVSYSGWNAATYVAEEIKSPERVLPRALLVGTAAVTALYLALNVVFIYAAPIESMKGIVAVGALAASKLFGTQVAGVFSGIMAASLLSTINAMTLAGPRVYYAMALKGQFFSKAAIVHPQWKTPAYSILAQGFCTVLLVFTPFTQLVIYIGFTLNLFAVLSVISLLLFRRDAKWRKLRAISFAYPLIPVLFISIGLWMTAVGILQQPLISFIAICTMASGAILYHALHVKSQAQPLPS